MIDWIRIDQLGDRQQQELFARSEKVYLVLFNPEFTEAWKNFAKYIKDTARRRPKRHHEYPIDYCEDFYYVGVIDEIVCGMMFFTGYPKSHGFVAYMGVVRELDGARIDGGSRAVSS